MTAIPIKVRIIVDPCGRVLVHETERLAPGESYCQFADDGTQINEPPDGWYHMAGCVTHTITIDVPVPHITTPRIAFSKGVERT